MTKLPPWLSSRAASARSSGKASRTSRTSCTYSEERALAVGVSARASVGPIARHRLHSLVLRPPSTVKSTSPRPAPPPEGHYRLVVRRHRSQVPLLGEAGACPADSRPSRIGPTVHHPVVRVCSLVPHQRRWRLRTWAVDRSQVRVHNAASSSTDLRRALCDPTPLSLSLIQHLD